MTGPQDARGLPVEAPRDNLLEAWAYFVEAGGVTLQFLSLNQIEEAKVYFSRTTHPVRREAGITLEHYWQRWFERLPKGVQGGRKRAEILKALTAALDEFRI